MRDSSNSSGNERHRRQAQNHFYPENFLPLFLMPFSMQYAEQTALAIFETGDYLTAEKMFAAAVEQRPADWRLHCFYGQCAFHLGRLREAAAAQKTAVKLAPAGELAPRLRLLEIYIELKDESQAGSLINMLNQTHPDNLELRLLQIKNDLEAERYDRVFEEASQMLASQILLEEPFAHLARAAVITQRTQEVADVIEEGILLYPENSFLNEAAAQLASSGGDFAAALKYYELALKSRPGNMALLLAYAFCLYQTGNIERAYLIAGELKNSPHANSVVKQFFQQLDREVNQQ